MLRPTILVAAIAALLAPVVRAQDADYIRTNYTKQEVHIPMRDGVKLFAVVYVPKDTARRHPIIMTRTPYSVAPYEPDSFPRFVGNQRRAYFHAGYIVVYEDVRGRYMSEGQYVNVRPYIAKKSKKDIDETTDTYDTVDWLVKNVRGNNGRVGISGISYPGFYSSMSAIDAHPAVKAVSPQAPVSQWMSGDDFFHNGAFLFPHAFDFYVSFGKPKPGPHTDPDPRFDHGTPDGYQFYLNLGPVSNANTRYLHDSVPFWNELMQHGSWDDFWAARSVLPHLVNLKPAMLWVGGWFDTENLYGALHAYAAAERQSPGAVNRLVMGPWSHGQWAYAPGDSLGSIGWGQSTALFYTDSIEFPFMNYYLSGDSTAPKPKPFEAAVFETGTNVWRFLDKWPPASATPRNLYLREGWNLSFDPPTAKDSSFDEYTSDPGKPVPYTSEITHWYNPSFMLADQRFADRRPDVLVYRSEPLADEVTVAGPIKVDFDVSTTGTDCDWIVKVIDVFPDDYDGGPNPDQLFSRGAEASRLGGYEMLVRGDVLRGKFRNSMSKPEPFTPGAVTPIHFEMNDIYHTFRKGHRIMIQVQSTWFPMIDRNPGKFLDIYHATAADFQKTVQRVYRSAAAPSHVVLTVLKGAQP